MTDQIEALFPAPLMRCKDLLDPPLRAGMLERIARATTKQNAKSQKLSHTDVIDPSSDELFRRLVQLAGPKLTDFGLLLFGERQRWLVKEMWTNVLETGGQQFVHCHSNSFVSGVVYVTESHPSANTTFVRGTGGANEFVFRQLTPNTVIGPYNAGKYTIQDVEPGEMILFPSHMLHEVPRNQGGMRVTVAFNAIPERLDSLGYSIQFGR